MTTIRIATIEDAPLPFEEVRRLVSHGATALVRLAFELNMKSRAIPRIIDAHAQCAYNMRMLYGPVNGASDVHRAPQ